MNPAINFWSLQCGSSMSVTQLEVIAKDGGGDTARLIRCDVKPTSRI